MFFCSPQSSTAEIYDNGDASADCELNLNMQKKTHTQPFKLVSSSNLVRTKQSDPTSIVGSRFLDPMNIVNSHTQVLCDNQMSRTWLGKAAFVPALMLSKWQMQQ